MPKNKPNGYWTYRVYFTERGWSDERICSGWKDLPDDAKTEWKEYAKNGGAPPQGFTTARVPEPTHKKAKKTHAAHKPDTSSSVDPESMFFNPHNSRDVQAMIDEKKMKLSEKDANVREFSVTLPGKITAGEAAVKPAVFIHMFPLYDGDEKSYNLSEWFPSIIYAARFSLTEGATHEYHTFALADDVQNHVERCQMLNEGRCLTLHGVDRMSTGPRLPIPHASSSSITGEEFPGWNKNFAGIVKNLDSLISSDNGFPNVVFAHPTKTQNPDLQENWMLHCLEQELMLRRLLKDAKAQILASGHGGTPDGLASLDAVSRLERIRIQPLGYYWSTMHAVKMVDDVEKVQPRDDAFASMIKETKLQLGRQWASLVVRPYMKCPYHSTEDNKNCMPAEGRTILLIMFSDLLVKYKLAATSNHDFTKVEQVLRQAVRDGHRQIVNVYALATGAQLPLNVRSTAERQAPCSDEV